MYYFIEREDEYGCNLFLRGYINLLLRVDVSDDLDTLALLLEESGTSFNLVQFLGTWDKHFSWQL